VLAALTMALQPCRENTVMSPCIFHRVTCHVKDARRPHVLDAPGARKWRHRRAKLRFADTADD
jgi:hypothetical protein